MDKITVQLTGGILGGDFVKTEAEILLLGVEGCQPAEICRQMCAMYGAA